MKQILFFTPILPACTGNGSAIRAGIALQLLAERHRVTVIHVAQWPIDATVVDDRWVRSQAAAYHRIAYPPESHAAQMLVAEHLSGMEVAALYVFRLSTVTFALQVIALLCRSFPPNALDLDDDECARTEKFIPIREASGDRRTADAERARLSQLLAFQRLLLLRFDICYLASPAERDVLARRWPDKRFEVLPNVVRLPDPPVSRTPAGRDVLFLGSLGYLPNEDGVLYFCERVLPALQASGEPVSLRVVGTNVPYSIRKWHGKSGVDVVGPVRDVAVEYARARITIVPLRVGSGTRIKILEAFSYGVPVVSTSAGAEGLDVKGNVHLLLADTPEEFAGCCRRLLEDQTLASTLTANAMTWLREHHTPAAVRDIFHSLFR